MRALTIALWFLAFASQPLRAEESQTIAADFTALAPLPDQTALFNFSYDRESLTGDLVLDIRRARISMGITNILRIPQHEPLGGVYIDEHTLLTNDLNGIEVDIGSEPAFSLTFSVSW